MNRDFKVLLLNLPSPPYFRLWRDTAGGFGTVILHHSYRRKQAGETSLHPFLPYASSLLLEAGYEFKIIDCQKLKFDALDALREVKKEDPDVIFSIVSLPTLRYDLRILDKIKESLQNVIIVAVGTVCRVLPNEVLHKSKVDIALRSSYPYTFNMINLIRSLEQLGELKKIGNISYKKNREIIHTPDVLEPEIADLPFPCYDFLQLDGYETISDKNGKRYLYIPILESKGCPYRCIYCPYPLGFGRKIMFRFPKAIVDEMEHLYSTYNIKGFLLRGQTFAYNRKRAIKICEEIIRRKLDVAWFCESRVDEVSRELLNKMKKAGCIRIHYGVETGDPQIIKMAKPGVRLETTEKAFKITKKLDILTQAQMILGWPDESYKTLEKTRKFILSLDPDEINLNFLTPYPGTPLYEMALKNSLLLTTDWSMYTSHTVVMKTKNLSAEELYKFKEKIIRDFSRQKLRKLISNPSSFRKPRRLINLTRRLVSRMIFPEA